MAGAIQEHVRARFWLAVLQHVDLVDLVVVVVRGRRRGRRRRPANHANGAHGAKRLREEGPLREALVAQLVAAINREVGVGAGARDLDAMQHRVLAALLLIEELRGLSDADSVGLGEGGGVLNYIAGHESPLSSSRGSGCCSDLLILLNAHTTVIT